jgi:hypothetical protein
MKDEYFLVLLQRVAIISVHIFLVVIAITVFALSDGSYLVEFKLVWPHISTLSLIFEWVLDSLKENNMLVILLAFIPGILGISYPLIIQTISKLNEQYKSTHIVQAFKKEWLHKWFLWSLVVSSVFAILCLTKNVTIIALGYIALVNLIVSFFIYLNLVLTYQNGNDLFAHYLNGVGVVDNESNKDLKIKKVHDRILKYWHPVIDLFTYSIIAGDRKLRNDIYSFFISKAFYFIKYVEKKNQEVMEFPDEFYNSTYDIVATFVKNNDDNYYQNVEAFAGSIFFVESYDNADKKQSYHQKTYYSIWRNLVLLIEGNRGDKLVRYWGSAHQHCTYKFSTPNIEHDENHNETKASIELREKIRRSKRSFFQFHTVVCAYLMYKENYKTLKEVWFYTQSQPPDYLLVPRSLDDVFQLYFIFLNDRMSGGDFVIDYWFRDLSFDAMNNVLDVKAIVRKYCCLLFLKQWITPSWYGQNQFAMPQLPSNQGEKKHWAKNIKYIENIVNKHLADPRLMKELGLDVITRQECRMRSIPYPLNYLSDLRLKLEEGFKQTLRDLQLDKEKKDALDNYTIDRIRVTFQKLSRLGGSEVLPAERDSVSDNMTVIRGNRIILDKEAFVNNSSVDYLHYDRAIGDLIVQQYYFHISVKFLSNASIQYQVRNGELFSAVDKLGLKKGEHLIISFNVNLEYLRDHKGVQIEGALGNEDFNYKSIPIYSFNKGIPAVDNTLFILRKVDLPMIKHKDWTEIQDLNLNDKARWQAMELIDDPLKIYRKFTELDKDQKLLKSYLDTGKEESELQNMLEIDVDFLGYCWFKRGIKMVSIQEIDMFQEGGARNSLEDIAPF